MAVSKKRSNGSGSIYKRGDNFYLQYMQKDGKRKNITLKNSQGNHIRERREAEEAARKFLQEQQQLKEIETREEYLAELKVVRKLKARLLITLDNAFDLAQAKPHSRETSNRVLAVSRGYWFDFVDFVKSNYQLRTLDEVERMHADAYIAYIRKYGRWNKTISYDPNTCPKRKVFKDYERGGLLSHTTLNRYHSVCKSVFSFLLPDLGGEENPFAHIPPLKLEPVKRKIFTEEELEIIFKNPPKLLVGPLFVGRYTGLRLGDVLALKWEYFEGITGYRGAIAPDFTGREISLIAQKTKTQVHVPVFPELNKVLQKQWKQTRRGEYVFPEMAELHLQKRYTKINTMIQNYLISCGITTRIEVEGRTRKQTVKGFHSFRHTFSYEAEQKGVPASTIKRWLGHKRLAQTQHYQDHANKQASMEGLKLIMQNSIPVTSELISGYSLRKERLLHLIQNASETTLAILETLIDNLPDNLPDANQTQESSAGHLVNGMNISKNVS